MSGGAVSAKRYANRLWLARIGPRLRRAREAAGLTSWELAKRIGVSWSCLSRWERSTVATSNARGQSRQWPPLYALHLIAMELRIPVEELLP